MQGLQEKIENVHRYLAFLKDLEIKLLEDEIRLDASASEAEDIIRSSFLKIRETVLEELENRERTLIDIVKKFHLSESVSIKNRVQDVMKNVITLENLLAIREQQDLFRKTFEDGMEAIREDCLNLSLQKPIRITAQFTDQHKIASCCRNFGTVACGAPVEIIKPKPRPGAILVQWRILAQNLEVEQYRLQKMQIRSPLLDKKHKFEDCYIGANIEHLDKNVIPNEQYVYRVCLKYEGHVKWSEWSLPKLATTNFSPLCWKNNLNFALSCNNTVAESLAEKPAALYSVGFTFSTGFFIEITFIKCDNILNDSYIGLSATEEYVENFLDLRKAILLETNGYIFSDGQRKTTKLPPVKQGKKVVFTCERYEEGKIRLHIDNHNMRVTYDWNLESPQIYVCCNFRSPNWKIAIN